MVEEDRSLDIEANKMALKISSNKISSLCNAIASPKGRELTSLLEAIIFCCSVQTQTVLEKI